MSIISSFLKSTPAVAGDTLVEHSIFEDVSGQIKEEKLNLLDLQSISKAFLPNINTLKLNPQHTAITLKSIKRVPFATNRENDDP